jgi:hypothetical protein
MPKIPYKYFVVILPLIVLMISFIVVPSFFKSEKSKEPQQSQLTRLDEVLGTHDEKNRLVISDQRPGSMVKVDQFSLEEPGYIVITDSLTKEVVGVSNLVQGENQTVSILFTQPTVEHQKLVGSMVIDDGDGVYTQNDIEKKVMNILGHEIIDEFEIKNQ